MELDNLSLAYLILELKPLLENAFVNKVSDLGKGVLKMKLHTKSGSKDLIITPNIFYLTQYSIPARQAKSNFAAALKKQLYNSKILSIEQHNFDRVVEIKFLEKTLVLEFLGEGNKILVDSSGKIIACEKNEQWADRKTRRGETYIFPKTRGLNPAKISGKTLSELFLKSEKDVVRTLVAELNTSPQIAEEALFNLQINKGVKAKGLNAKEAEKIALKLNEFYSHSKEKFSPVSYGGQILAPFPLTNLHASGEKGVEIKSINSFLDESLSKTFSQENAPEKKSLESGVAKPKIDAQKRLEFHKKQQEESKNKFLASAEENRIKAELIYQHYSEIEELRSAVLTAMGKGLKEKEIMYKMSLAAEKGNKTAKLLKSLDLGKKKFEIEL